MNLPHATGATHSTAIVAVRRSQDGFAMWVTSRVRAYVPKTAFTAATT